jgi:hypothetical protein
MSALGQKQTSRGQGPMSALPPKADIHCGSRNVCFVPLAEVGRLVDYLIGDREYARWNHQPQRLCGLAIEHEFKFGRL